VRLASAAFPDGQEIPRRHGYKSGNQRPPLSISGVPGKRRSFAAGTPPSGRPGPLRGPAEALRGRGLPLRGMRASGRAAPPRNPAKD